MPTQLREPATAVRRLALTGSERVVVEAMTLRLLLRDRATLTTASRIAARDEQIATRVRNVREGLALTGDTTGAAGLADRLVAAGPEDSARLVDDAVDALGATVTGRSRALLVLVDVCFFAPDRTSWNGRARYRALRELTAALPALDVADLERVLFEVASARRALAWRRLRWGRIVATADRAPDEVLRLAVATCVVAIAEHGDIEAAKEVVRTLQDRLDSLVATIGAPAERDCARQVGAAIEAAVDLIR